MRSAEATNTNLIVFGWTQQGLVPTFYRTSKITFNNFTENWNIW